MSGGPTPEEKRRIVRLVLLLAILVSTTYALMHLADRLREAQESTASEGPSEAETVD